MAHTVNCFNRFHSGGTMRRFMTVLTLLFSAVHAQAQGLKDLSNADAVAGLKEAL
jgi:hypothetical protein